MSYGVGPYGYGTVVPGQPPTRAPIGSSRAIGTGAEDRGQYVIENGNPRFESDVRQLVILALTTVKGSTAIQDLGRDPEPMDFSGNFTERKREQVRRALAHLIADKVISIEAIDIVEISGGRSFTRLLLTDLTRNQLLKVEL